MILIEANRSIFGTNNPYTPSNVYVGSLSVNIWYVNRFCHICTHGGGPLRHNPRSDCTLYFQTIKSVVAIDNLLPALLGGWSIKMTRFTRCPYMRRRKTVFGDNTSIPDLVVLCGAGSNNP